MLYIQKTQTGRRARKVTQSEGMDLVRKGVAVLAKQGGHQIYADCALFHPDRLRMLQARQGDLELLPTEPRAKVIEPAEPVATAEKAEDEPVEEPKAETPQTYQTRDLKPRRRVTRKRGTASAQSLNASE